MSEINFNKFLGPGGLQAELIGSPLASGSIITPHRVVHEVSGTGTISTIVIPYEDFVGPLILLAEDAWNWDANGNIAAASGGDTVAGLAYVFIFNRARNKWYSILPTVV